MDIYPINIKAYGVGGQVSPILNKCRYGVGVGGILRFFTCTFRYLPRVEKVLMSFGGGIW